jgi:hypothetical protein
VVTGAVRKQVDPVPDQNGSVTPLIVADTHRVCQWSKLSRNKWPHGLPVDTLLEA